MNISGKILRCAAVAAVGAGTLAFTAAPAGADTTECQKFHVAGGWGCYQSYGDIIRVSDTGLDGWGIRVIWSTSDGREGSCVDANGSDNGTETCNYQLKEKYNGGDNLITFQVQQVDEGEPGDKSGWQGITT